MPLPPKDRDEPPPRSWDLRVTTVEREGVAILSLKGRLSRRTSTVLRHAIEQAAIDHSAVVLDMRLIDYISSPGMTLLAETVERGVPPLIACGLSDPVRIALELAGLSDALPAAASVTDALGRIAEGRRASGPDGLRDQAVGADN